MPLSAPTTDRQRLHTRRITIEGYRRTDGLWDIEGSLIDVKDHDLRIRSVYRRAGEPVHCMRIRLTVDGALKIVAAEAAMEALPYWGLCDAIGSQYQQLVGLKIGRGFRRAVGERLGGVKGCSHVTGLVTAMAAGAIQTLAPELNKDVETQPVQLSGCHAWSSDGPLVKEHYPQWYVAETRPDLDV